MENGGSRLALGVREWVAILGLFLTLVIYGVGVLQQIAELRADVSSLHRDVDLLQRLVLEKQGR